MKANVFRFRYWLAVLSLFGLLATGATNVPAQGQPPHPPAPGQMSMIPLAPIGMPPVGPLPYSWEVGKHQTQRFGDYNVGKRSREVKKLLKLKRKELKANNR